MITQTISGYHTLRENIRTVLRENIEQENIEQ